MKINAVLLSLGCLGYSYAAGPAMQDKKFMMEAAKGGMMEVQMGHEAVDHAKNADVKKFGQRMVDDHGKANDELMALAKQKGIMLPPAPPAPAMKMTGDFDKKYARDMVADHHKDIALFEKEANSGTDPDVKGWAAKTLPTLRDHLKQAEALPK